MKRKKLMTNWKEFKLSDVCDVRDGTCDTPKQSEYIKAYKRRKN